MAAYIVQPGLTQGKKDQTNWCLLTINTRSGGFKTVLSGRGSSVSTPVMVASVIHHFQSPLYGDKCFGTGG